MRKLAIIILCTMGLNACASLNLGDMNVVYRHNQQQKLDAAIALQKAGKISSAVESFKALCAERGLQGITDEALFRLSILYLDNGLDNDREFIQLAQQNMDRLKKEYPASSWTAMAEPISVLLSNIAELRRQNLNSKNQNQALSKENQALSKENQALSKENQELKESIEKLKRLDVELDKKRN
jgi:hypothetical protein